MRRRNNQEIYFDFQEDKKINLILAVSSSKVIYYKITSGPTNKDIFKLLMEELYEYESLSEQEEEKILFFPCLIYHLIQLLSFLLYIKKKNENYIQLPI